MKRFVIIAGLILLATWVAYLVYNRPQTKQTSQNPDAIDLSDSSIIKNRDRVKNIIIPDGATFGEFMTEQGLEATEANQIYEVANRFYDLAKIKAGKTFDFKYHDDVLVGLSYDIDETEQLLLNKESAGWQASLAKINYDIKATVVRASVTTSLYEAGLSAGLAEGLIIELADIFQWTIDFSMDVRAGDKFAVLYESRTRDGQPAPAGRILAATYSNDDKTYEMYYFETKAGKGAYFDDSGRGAPKRFLKSPLAFRYISSGFTGNPRYVGGQYQRYTANHLAIDYAAPSGTPIRAVADGKIVFAGWKSGYGNFISLRHDKTYTTNYGHLSQILVKRGQSVSQNQTIGKVGSTGFSTGPHLHYEMVKAGVKINPLKEVQPPSAPLTKEDLEAFIKVKDSYKEKLQS